MSGHGRALLPFNDYENLGKLNNSFWDCPNSTTYNYSLQHGSISIQYEVSHELQDSNLKVHGMVPLSITLVA